ncbi:MAG TPA: hypothetical protein VIK20_00455 [Bacteroidales bacterium]
MSQNNSDTQFFIKFKRIFPYLRCQWKKAVYAGIFMLISILLQLPLPLLTKELIDNILPNKNVELLNWEASGSGLDGLLPN